MAQPSRPSLTFPPAHTREGFTTYATTAWAGNPEPIARELLQNCLDAAREADATPAEVHFTIEQACLSDVPGIDAYREHFEIAVQEHGADPTGPAATIIARIREALDTEETSLLVCRDNGLGFNEERLDGLLGEGSSRKSEEHTGSYGVGHLTAFSASDLRYVLYAGRGRDGHGGTNDIASGHAILASGGKDGAHGYWIQQPTLFDQERYTSEIPAILSRHVGLIEQTGSVVCIPAFNSFRDADSDASLALRQAAAMHFLAAVHSGAMTVSIRDHGGPITVVDRSALPDLLDAVRDESRPRIRGSLRGDFAYGAWLALEAGETLDLAGAEVRVRKADAGTQRESRVHVFRNGMWITSGAPQLRPRDFAGFEPFDAVVLLDHGELYSLVCAAEGPEHRGLDRQRTDRKQWRQLRALFDEIADGLREHVGATESSQKFTPIGFAAVRGNVLHQLGDTAEIWDAFAVAGQRLLDACPRGGRVRDLPGPDRIAERIARRLLGDAPTFPAPGPQHHPAMLAVTGVFADETEALGTEGESLQWRVYRHLTVQSAGIAGLLPLDPGEQAERYFDPSPGAFALAPPDWCVEHMHDVAQDCDEETIKKVLLLIHDALSLVSDAILGSAALHPHGDLRDALQFAARTVSRRNLASLSAIGMYADSL